MKGVEAINISLTWVLPPLPNTGQMLGCISAFLWRISKHGREKFPSKTSN